MSDRNPHDERPGVPDPDRAPLTVEQEVARAAVRGLGVPAAPAEFRARMRAAFVSGDFGTASATDDAVVATQAQVEPRVRSRSSPLHIRHRAGARSWSLAIAVAAAAVILLGIGLANRGGGWTITAVGANPTVIIDGEEVSCADLSPIEAALHAGCQIVVPENGRMELLNARNFLVELGGGVEFTLPRAPGRWFGRDVHSDVDGTGTVRVATASGFEGATYRLRTSSTELTVTGTAFTVIHGEDSVCLCVLEGEVSATLPDGSVASIGAGRRVFVSSGDGMIDHGPMLEAEREALLALRARADQLGTGR